MDRVGAVPVDEITVDLAADDQGNVLVAGKFQPGKRHNGASADGKDVVIEAVWADTPDIVAGSLEVMIRVRKNANELSSKARNDFLDALAFLNGIGDFPAAGAGRGIYVTDFVGMHVAGAYSVGHGDSHFLPWHRLYLLDLERLLQKVNPAVTLPYWQFDETAEHVFTQEFMGETETIPDNTPFTPGWSDKLTKFDPANPISGWKIGEVNGIRRAAYFDTKNSPALGLPDEATSGSGFRLINEMATLLIGGADDPEMGTRSRGARDGFAEMEGTPHGAAHISFNGSINAVPEAPRDPLFFLLHCNVDRLWALWQFLFDRFTVRHKQSYPYQDKLEIIGHSEAPLEGLISGTFPDSWKVLFSPQWPWDSGLSKPGHLRPPGTRSGNFTSSIGAKNLQDAPPRLADAIDAFGLHVPADYLGYAYDDVPFGHDRTFDQFEDLSTADTDNQIVISSNYRKEYLKSLETADNEATAMDEATRRVLEIARDPREVDKLIAVINDPTSEVDKKVAAIDTLNNVSNFSPQVRSRMAEIVNALRGMMTSAHEPLRIRALSTLAMMKDEVAQEMLLQELQSDTDENDRMIPTAVAISMLGKDEKALPASLLLKIAANPPTPESREEAVRHMSAGLESFHVLKEIMEDDSNSLEVRAMIPEKINNVDATAFLSSASAQLQTKGTQHDLAPFLAKGIAGVSDPEALAPASETKAMIRKLKADAPESFKNLANKLLFKDDDSPNQ